MSEIPNWNTSPEVLHEPLSQEELRVIGDTVIHAAATIDLQAAVIEHEEKIGVSNPNSVAPGIFIGRPEIGVDMSSGNAYRSVDRRAIEDLTATGVVRGAYTATDGKRANSGSNTAYWSLGADDKKHGFATPGHMIIETPRENAELGWVTADKINAVYAQDRDGNVHNIINQETE